MSSSNISFNQILDPARLLSPVPNRLATLKEFFDLSTYCGDFSSTGLPIQSASNLNQIHGVKGCGARDWRVFRWAIFAPGDHILCCQNCGLRFGVTVT